MHLKGGSILQSGKYRIIRVLGQGGFGITYLAENTFFDKKVAIKEFFPKDFCGRDNTSHLTLGTQNNAETVEKLKASFFKEAKNIAKLDHPGIVKIHDVFEENNTAYYVMDYIDGENLNEMVKRTGALPEKKAVEYIQKVGVALDYIHSRNMTHFDVKPANIMVRRTDNQPILIDFGLSKQYDSHGDATSALMQGVSRGYSPIELYNVGALTSFSPQTDVYSLGATLYYLLTGVVPPSASAIIEDGLTFPTIISAVNATVIRDAMANSRSKRTPSVYAFLNALSTNTTTDSTTSNPPSNTDSNNDEQTRIINEESEKSNPPKPPSSPQYPTIEEPDEEKSSYGCWPGIAAVVLIIVLFPIILSNQILSSSNNTKSSTPSEKTERKQKNTHTTGPIKCYIQDIGSFWYEGELDSKGRPHGEGYATFIDGNAKSYIGSWYYGKLNKGLYTLKNNDTFNGQWINNQYNSGTYTIHRTGEYFVGSFVNGQPYSGDWYNKNGRIIK